MVLRQGLFSMAGDSDLFRTREELENLGFHLAGNRFARDHESYEPLLESKMQHIYDHRFGTYSGQTQAQANKGFLPQLNDAQHADPSHLPMPKFWVATGEINNAIPDEWRRPWLLTWRAICRSVDERTFIPTVCPRVGVAHSAMLGFPSMWSGETICGLIGDLSSFVFDYQVRQKVGGSNMSNFITEQLPVLSPESYLIKRPWLSKRSCEGWLRARVLELTFTASDLSGFARDCGYDGPPWRWDDGRRFMIRAELDAAYLHFYEIGREDAEHILETFFIVKRKDIEKHGHYRTKDTILAIYDEMAEAIGNGRTFESRVEPPPGPPANSDGSFAPLPEWKEGEPRPADWPPHIHPPHRSGPRPPTDTPPASPRKRGPTGPADLVKPVVQAFADVREGTSSDYVVADPELNARFRHRARDLGADADDLQLNLTLIGARKRGLLGQLATTREYRLPRKIRPYTFASEWAVRHVQREILAESNRLVTLDTILCDPGYAARFDVVAEKIKPGFTAVEYRWAALALRKMGSFHLSPRRIQPPDQQLNLFDWDLEWVPKGPGLYLIRAGATPLFLNHATDLREQVGVHVAAAGPHLIPDWLLREPSDGLAYTFMPGMDRDALLEFRTQAVAGQRPWLNLLDLAGAA